MITINIWSYRMHQMSQVDTDSECKRSTKLGVDLNGNHSNAFQSESHHHFTTKWLFVLEETYLDLKILATGAIVRQKRNLALGSSSRIQETEKESLEAQAQGPTQDGQFWYFSIWFNLDLSKVLVPAFSADCRLHQLIVSGNLSDMSVQ